MTTKTDLEDEYGVPALWLLTYMHLHQEKSVTEIAGELSLDASTDDVLEVMAKAGVPARGPIE
jgi:hypothetical protein